MVRAIIEEKQAAYALARSVAEKSAIVDGIVLVSGMHRKAVIRALGRMKHRSVRHTAVPAMLGRPKKYTTECEAALAFVWTQYNYPSAERLEPQISEAVRIFRRDGIWSYSPVATEQLLGMSLGAMKVRTTRMAKQRGLLRGVSTTRRSDLLRSVPVFHGSWKSKGPGHGQIDTVVHSGEKLFGTMVYTVNYIDVATYWQELASQLDKTDVSTLQSIRVIAQRLPWPLRELHPDSGSEFLNDLVLTWARKRKIDVTRSRPHKSNDNCFIEQRNLSVVRKYVGYERYDCEAAVDAMNELYAVLRLYVNYFQPTFKLKGKEKRVDAAGKQYAKPYKRVYDMTRTPYQRVLEHPDIPQATKALLTAEYETLNPKVLRERIRTLTTNLERSQRVQGYHP